MRKKSQPCRYPGKNVVKVLRINQMSHLQGSWKLNGIGLLDINAGDEWHSFNTVNRNNCGIVYIGKLLLCERVELGSGNIILGIRSPTEGREGECQDDGLVSGLR